MDKKYRRNLEKFIAMDVYFYSSTIYYNENNHVVQIAIPLIERYGQIRK